MSTTPGHLSPKFIPAEKSEITSVSKLDGFKFSFVSYNILSQAFVKGAALFPHSPGPCLKWKARSQAILTVLKSFKADFLCLQEMDEYDSFYKSNIESGGYSSIYVQRSGKKHDGCGIFYKQDSAELVIEEKIDYNDLVPSIQDDTASVDKEENLPADGKKKLASKCAEPDPGFQEDGCAITKRWIQQLHSDVNLQNSRADRGDLNDPRVRLKRDCVGVMAAFRLKDPCHFIIVTNTHICWDPELTDVKLVQAKYLLSRLAQFKLQVSDKFNCSPSVVVAGDFNSLPGDQVYQYLISGSSVMGTLPESSDDVPIPLCSVYASTRGEPHFTNCTPVFTGTIDYILFSPSGDIKPVSYLELPEPGASDVQGGLPNYYHPSDHLPIGAEFEIVQ
ncbi:carbon catabolite repressor protein 4 homolog 4-like isoform X2 [Lycium ferocissimum]|uniref:carbon catabolite repressor protein 4 homolog 4-like isoform X2 n=1 Tax=Lycium ferocissimum TaxID=112874 RepID=UPI002815DF42|nr:carbon catabolite repressor protein 4 homolog 4-like isoform X2 [Lycium ferocissimum]